MFQIRLAHSSINRSDICNNEDHSLNVEPLDIRKRRVARRERLGGHRCHTPLTAATKVGTSTDPAGTVPGLDAIVKANP